MPFASWTCRIKIARKSYIVARKMTLKKDEEQLLFTYRKGGQLMNHQADTHKPVFVVLVRSKSPQRKLDFGGGFETKVAPRM